MYFYSIRKGVFLSIICPFKELIEKTNRYYLENISNRIMSAISKEALVRLKQISIFKVGGTKPLLLCYLQNYKNYKLRPICSCLFNTSQLWSRVRPHKDNLAFAWQDKCVYDFVYKLLNWIKWYSEIQICSIHLKLIVYCLFVWTDYPPADDCWLILVGSPITIVAIKRWTKQE